MIPETSPLLKLLFVNAILSAIYRVAFAFRIPGKDQSRQDLVEYALLAGLAATLAIAVFPAIASTSALYSHAMNALSLALSSTAEN